MLPSQLADPLGPGVLASAVSDIQGLVTGTYAPVMVGAILFGTALSIAFRWIRRATRTAGAAK
jgi:hypothetical protein